MRPVTPRGFRDVLPAEAAERSEVTDELGRVFSSWGYDLVETPVLEDYETLAAGAGALEDTAFRVFDVDGRLLALRPDMTVPIARLVAARTRADARITRLRYRADVFREHESLRGQARQFNQVGVELIGTCGYAADAEVIGVLVEALEAIGLADFRIAIGDVAVLSALVDAAGGDDDWRDAVFAAAHARNLVALDRLGGQPGLAAGVGELLGKLVRTRGDAAAIEAARALLARVGRAEVLDGLASTVALLEGAGLGGRLIVDFGVMRDFGYYTGLVLEAYAPGLGVPLGGGGRYDGLLGKYGVAQPAAGFALGVERLIIALAEQSTPLASPKAPVSVAGDPAAAFAEAKRRRSDGERVAIDHASTAEERA